MMIKWVGLCVLLVTVGCASPPPYEDYTLARAALKAARDCEAPRYAVSLWNQAEDFYRRGEKNYQENDFGEAAGLFQSAMKAAEKAENSTRLKKFLSGGGAP